MLPGGEAHQRECPPIEGVGRIDDLDRAHGEVGEGNGPTYGCILFGVSYSFQGINAGAFYHRSPVEEALPVSISPYDDRVEVLEDAPVEVADAGHPILEGISGEWPILLGYNRVEAKPDAATLALVGDGDPLLVAGGYGSGRTLAWTSDIAPHWCPEPFTNWDGYTRLWNNAVAWLSE
jgi:uncharacterized membrane protein